LSRASPIEQALAADLRSLSSRELAPVEVAVLDTGIDATHPHLAGRVSEAFEIVREGERMRVRSAAPGANNDRDGHGTAVASVVASVARNARIVDVQIIGADERETSAALVEGLRFATLRRFPVVNLSLACHEQLLAEVTRVCEQAAGQGQALVAARRNTSLLEHGIPAALSACIGVDVGRFDSPLDFVFQPTHPIELIASGQDVEVAAPGGGVERRSGTSYAAPAIAGVCALLLGAFPGLAPFDLKSVLRVLATR
jgi:subtilisin family serine protease